MEHGRLKTLHDQPAHRQVGEDGGAEVALQHPDHPDRELLQDWPVEAKLAARGRHGRSETRCESRRYAVGCRGYYEQGRRAGRAGDEGTVDPALIDRASGGGTRGFGS